MDPDYGKISVTARLVAYYRQFSDIPFAGEVARAVGADDVFRALVREHALKEGDLLEYAPLFEARYKSLVRLLSAVGITQVLEVASGISLRGLAMARDPRWHYVETDLPELTEEKRHLLAALQSSGACAARANHHVAAANALDLAQLQAAVAPLDRSEPLAIVTEGLIMYLSAEERDALADNVARLLREFAGGVWMTPDFSLKSQVPEVSGERQRLRQAVAGMTSRDLNRAAFESNEAMAAFFERFGFAAEMRDALAEAGELVSVRTLQLPPETTLRLKGRLNVWILRPH